MKLKAALVAILALAVMLLLLEKKAPAQAAEASDVTDTSFVEENGSRILSQAVIVPAPLSDVWTAFTTADGWRSWAAPVAFIDFEVGGIIETSYRLGAKPGEPGNIKNQILAYLPQKLFIFRIVQSPEGFISEEVMGRLVFVGEFKALSPCETQVTLSGIGYRRDEESRRLFEFFREGNAWSLLQLKKRFIDGPVDWSSLIVPGAEAQEKEGAGDGN